MSNEHSSNVEKIAKEYNSKQLHSIPKDGRYGGSFDEHNLLEYLEKTSGEVWCLLDSGCWRPFKNVTEMMEHLCKYGFLSRDKNYFYSNISYIDINPIEDDSDPKMWRGVYFSYTTFREIIEKHFPDAIDEEENERISNLI